MRDHKEMIENLELMRLGQRQLKDGLAALPDCQFADFLREQLAGVQAFVDLVEQAAADAFLEDLGGGDPSVN